MKKLGWLLSLLFIISISLVDAGGEYTRERSEALHHLIDWQPYSPDTFDKAIKEQIPIYLVVSAPSWCYWCHVYESEDYLFNENLAPYINEHFIPIFVDSDKRPDLTRKYLEGGWPSTTIFTPNMLRIQGFTGPRDPIGLRQYLESVVLYLQDKDFSQLNLLLNYEESKPVLPTLIAINGLENNFLSYVIDRYDSKFGGIGLGDLPEWREGQKFPKGLTYAYLLEKHKETGNKQFLDIVKFTFDNQYTDISEIKTRYHLYDPVEGGFHRYSTKRDWSVPHYEKMAPEQAKFIRAYSDLHDITKDENVKIAVDGTINFVIKKFYDKDGGFYASQDAHLEDSYFVNTAEERAKLEQPYIDKTRQMDANGMMISSFLYLYDKTEESQFKGIAKTSLDFIQKNMIGNEGAFYYYDYEKKDAFLTGQSLANAWAILAFVEGYDSLGDEPYLATAEQVSQYSLDNLYDWNSGGFFERNSKDVEFYAPNERISLQKRYEDNAVFVYAMLRLYLATDNLVYLESGLKTLGGLMQQASGLDETYYVIKAGQLVRDNNLIGVYEKNNEKINNIVEEGKANFFLPSLLAQAQQQISLDGAPKLKAEFGDVGFIILIILALLAGFISFLSPCTLPVLTAYFAQSVHARRGEMLKRTFFFFLGLALVFSILGMGATFIGGLLRDNFTLFTRSAGILIIILGIAEVFGKGFSGLQLRFSGDKKRPIGSFLLGAVFAIGWSACIGPILASLLLLSATTGTVVKGTLLLFVYALGLGIPLLLLSFYFDKIKNKRFWKLMQGKIITLTLFKRKLHLHTTYIVSGIILIILGILIFNDLLFKLNQYALQTDFVQSVIIKSEEFLKMVFIR